MHAFSSRLRKITTVVTLAAAIAPLALQAPALADGAASTRNILIGAAATAAAVIVNNNRRNRQNQQARYQGRGNLYGTVQSYGGYSLQLTDNNGNYQNVHLHQGTVINPTGASLQGQPVQIFGYWNNDGTFEANEIDVRNGYYNGTQGYNRYPGGYNRRHGEDERNGNGWGDRNHEHRHHHDQGENDD